jgi:ABC-2 type transport system permease protein
VLKFWRNPEFVRHMRAELRPARAVMVAVVVLFLCALIGLACWSQRQETLEYAERSAQQFGGQWPAYVEKLRRENPRETWLLLCKWLFGLQAGLVTFWSLSMCAQSVSGERDRKTWDFQRTTSLTPAEIAVGKLLGEPVLAYFAALCVLPITFWSGLAGGVSFGTLLAGYIGMIASALFLGLCGLWLSTLLETRSRGIGLIGALALYGFALGTYGFAASWFPGLAAFSPLTGLHSILGLKFDGGRDVTPTLFGHAVPWLLVSLILYASFGAWVAVMLLRNLKRDYSEIRPLSRWQAVGCVAFLNFIFYALFSSNGSVVKSDDIATFMVSLNGAILFLVGLGSLTPHERLKVWWRSRAEGTSGMFSEDGLPWPWLVLSAAVAYGLMVWGVLAWRLSLDFHPGSLRAAALELLVVLIFITRDILFIQWCTLTRFRQPVVKGFLFLCLYYAAAGVMVAITSISGDSAAMATTNLLTPVGIFDPRAEWSHSSTSLYGGMALQAGLIAVILVAIGNRLGRPSVAPAVSEA